jgi:pyruvate dehydrogenase E2 component (dihydrolipoamide acetyltransferase)
MDNFFDETPRRIKATPLARKMAEAIGVSMEPMAGSGFGGRITKADVLLSTGPRRKTWSDAQAEKLAAVSVTLTTEADATEFVALRGRLAERFGRQWGFAPDDNDLLLLMVAGALQAFPALNAHLSRAGREPRPQEAINIGLGVETERGLVFPVIREANKKELRQLGEELRALAAQAQAGPLPPEATAKRSFTLLNLGAYPIDAFTPAIVPPAAAALGVGRIASRPVVQGDAIVIRQMVTLSLTLEARLTDMTLAARFLGHLRAVVEDPYLPFFTQK